MNNDTTIGQNIRRIRRAVHPNLSQLALGTHLGVSANSIQKYESGVNRIAAARIPLIAAFLGCDIMDLYEGTEDTT